MHGLRKSSGATALLLLLALTSCRQLENPGKTFPNSPGVDATRSHEVTRHPPQDIPVPRDMIYETRLNQSFSYFQGGVRVGRFRYWGNVPQQEVVVFYRERMADHPYGWTLVNERTSGNATTLSFRKDSDNCDVRIEPDASQATVATLYLNTQSTTP